MLEFPDGRKFSRESANLRPFGRFLTSICAAIPLRCAQIPYSAGQRIFSLRTENSGVGAGNSSDRLRTVFMKLQCAVGRPTRQPDAGDQMPVMCVCSIDPIWLGATMLLGGRRAPPGAVRQGRPPKRPLKPPGTKMTHMKSRIWLVSYLDFLSAQESYRSDDG